jgi:hypothetical protein
MFYLPRMAITGHILQDGGWVNVKIEVKAMG